MTVNHNDIKAMGDIMAALNRISDVPEYLEETVKAAPAIGAPIPVAPRHGDPSVAAMGEILARFKSVADHLSESDSPALMEALSTQKTKTGVIIGEWQIEKSDKTYSVVNTTTDYPIAHGLYLYEAALALTKMLNKGKSISSPDIKQILHLEEEYSRNVHDAALAKQRYSTTTGSKQQIVEARYQHAKQKALTAKAELKKYTV